MPPLAAPLTDLIAVIPFLELVGDPKQLPPVNDAGLQPPAPLGRLASLQARGAAIFGTALEIVILLDVVHRQAGDPELAAANCAAARMCDFTPKQIDCSCCSWSARQTDPEKAACCAARVMATTKAAASTARRVAAEVLRRAT